MDFNDGVFPDTSKLLSDPNIMIADTGATCYLMCNPEGIVKKKKASNNDVITAANGEEMMPTEIVNLPVTQIDKNGKEVQDLELKDVNLNPHGTYNIFSVTRRIKYGWKFYGDDTVLGLKKGSIKVEFDIVINTPKGLLFCTYFKRTEILSEKNLLAAKVSKGRKVSTENNKIPATLAHEILGNMGKSRTRATAKHMGF